MPSSTDMPTFEDFGTSAAKLNCQTRSKYIVAITRDSKKTHRTDHTSTGKPVPIYWCNYCNQRVCTFAKVWGHASPVLPSTEGCAQAWVHAASHFHPNTLLPALALACVNNRTNKEKWLRIALTEIENFPAIRCQEKRVRIVKKGIK
jgi:hypothetical protein